MARDATARLYDVLPGSVVFEKLDEKKEYDHGTITFRAKKGKLIDLDKLHESIWATRLSRGTSSGLVSIDVTVVGRVIDSGKETIIEIDGSNAHFVLGKSEAENSKDTFGKFRAAVDAGKRVVRVTGRVDRWAGRWPQVLSKLPSKPRRILVTGFEIVDSVESRNASAPSERANKNE